MMHGNSNIKLHLLLSIVFDLAITRACYKPSAWKLATIGKW